MSELDVLPAGPWKVYIKLLAAASWAGRDTGVLGFLDNPWGLRDTAAAIGVDYTHLSKMMKVLQSTTLRAGGVGKNYRLVWHGTFDGYRDPCYFLSHYEYFTGDEDADDC
jgi:hypothetical protein